MGITVLFVNTAGAQWTSIKSGPGGSAFLIWSLAVSGGNIYAGTGSGIFRSADSGASWTAVDSGLTTSVVMSLAVSGGTILAGTDSGIFLSANNGTIWTAIDSGLTNSGITCFVVSDGAIFAGTKSGIFLSADNGTSWTAIDSGLTNIRIWCLAASGGTIYAGTSGGVFLSANNGTSWAAADSGLPQTTVWSFAVSGNAIFAGTDGDGVYLSTDNGTSWSPANSGLSGERAGSLYIWCLAASNGRIFAGTDGDGIYLSANNGSSWGAVDSGISPGLTNSTVLSLAVDGSTVFAGTGGGLYSRPLAELAGVLHRTQPGAISQAVHLTVNPPGRACPNTTIEFFLPHSDRVLIGIYDLSGRHIKSLVNEYLSAGAYGVPWNARSMPSGYYSVRMQAGTYSLVKSVPIVR
jgi:ligand-binding sensor domain-containing protein